MVVVPYLVTRNPVAFRELLTAERITVLNQTPSAFRILRDADANTNAGLFLRYVIFGGENLSFADLLPWIDAHDDARPELINMYGITETTVHVTFRAGCVAKMSSAPTVPTSAARCRTWNAC